MVVIVSTTQYSQELEQQNASHFSLFQFPLSPFQKHAIQALIEGNHALITAHTGSGKTLPAEFAIQHFVRSQQKKVIYCSPIKALSNQKFYEFQLKYPDISFGLLTGDNKINPLADVLIMTTEILLNTLFIIQEGNQGCKKREADFEIDVEAQLSCVVFDEVHYINDPHRGHVWEKCMMLLPPQVQMLMLSATIDKATEFAEWVENISKKKTGSMPYKQVILASTNIRVVPLSHYAFLTTTESAFKRIKDKKIQQEIREAINKPLLLQDSTGQFKETFFQNTVVKTLYRLNNAQIEIKRKFVLNRLLEHLKSPDGSVGLDNKGKTMLPALLFLFSRKQVEVCAREITARLLDDDSKIPYTVRDECDALLRFKLPNHYEYKSLPEYEFLVSLLEKGIGIHHSGMISVFREIVELFISKNYIHLLIATESFAIGLDCPIKTVIFTHFHKFDGTCERPLLSHEYTQMAGRAGRRGIDTVGYVIHCNNLFKPPTSLEYRQMMSGKPECFVSKLGITAQMVLQVIYSGVGSEIEPVDTVKNVLSFVKNSLMNKAIEAQIKQQGVLLESLCLELSEKDAELIALVNTEKWELFLRFDKLQESEKMASHKKLKEISREKTVIQSAFNEIDGCQWSTYYNLWKEQQGLSEMIKKEKSHLNGITRYTEQKVFDICLLLERCGYLTKQTETCWTLTEKGLVASQLKEVDGLLMADLLLKTDYLSGYTAVDIIALLSCFCDIRTNEAETGGFNCEEKPELVSELIQQVDYMEKLQDEMGISLRGNETVVIQTRLFHRMMEWIKATDSEACSRFLQTLLEECDIGTGDFVKIILKIMAMKKEMEKVVPSVSLQYTLSQIDELLCKFVATSQSLYL